LTGGGFELPGDGPPGPPDSGRLRVARGVNIPFGELSWRFSTAGGPGGQHVNTSHTRAEVIFDVAGSPSLPGWARERLIAQVGPVVTATAGDRRSQVRNRDLALSRLTAKLQEGLEVKTPRRPTRPTKASQRRRLDEKRRRSHLKHDRRDDRQSGEGD
jgi:ribosome-associated protein